MQNVETTGTEVLGTESTTDYACAKMRTSDKARNVYQLFNDQILSFKTNGYTVTIQRTGEIQPTEEWFGTLYNVPALVTISGKEGEYYLVNKYMASQRSKKEA